MMNNSHILLGLFAAVFSAVSGCIKTYPAPPGIEPSDRFKVALQLEGSNCIPKSSFVYISRSNSRIGQASSVKPNRTVSWTSFAFTGSNILVSVVAPQDFKQCIVRPKRYGIDCQRDSAATATFIVKNHTQMMSVEFDYDYGSHRSDIVDKLLVFSDPPETDIPEADDPGVLYYGHGVHDLNGQLHLDDSVRHVYLAPGSFVMGGFRTTSRHPVTISGRGVLCGAKYPFHDPRFLWGIINLDIGLNHTVEGITMVNSPQFFYRGLSLNNVVRNVKTLAPWTYNSDGVGIGAFGLVEDSFFQTNDDTFKVYNDGMVVRRCVVWQSQNGAVFQFGWWNDRKAQNISIDQIDIIHTDWCTFRSTPCSMSGNDAVLDLAGKTKAFNLTRVNISNVRVEGMCPKLINFVMDPIAKGSVTRFRLTNWTIDELTPEVASNSQLGGSSLGGRLSNWNIRNLRIGGQCVSDPAKANISIDPKTTKNITFDCDSY